MPKVKSLDPVLNSMDMVVCFINKQMREKKLTQRDLAKELGIAPSNVSYKLSTRHLYASELIKIFHVIGATKEQIGELLML